MDNFTLDKVDRVILYELDINSRIPNSKLAKKARVSEQVVKYRIERLVDNKVIRYFYSVVNLGKLDLENFRMYLRFQNLTNEKEEELVSYQKENQNVVWVAKCRGHWDMVISFWAKSANEFSKIYKEFLSKFDNIILTKNICLIDRADHYNRAYFLENIESKLHSIYADVKEEGVVDEIDKKILKLISHDSRMSLFEIAKKINVSADTVRNRMKKLEEKQVINGYRTLFNLSKINYFNNMIIIKLHYLNSKRIKEFFAFAKEHKNIIFVMHCLGDHDIDLEVEVNNQQELDTLISDLRQKFSDIIRDMETLIIYDEPKFDFYPMK